MQDSCRVAREPMETTQLKNARMMVAQRSLALGAVACRAGENERGLVEAGDFVAWDCC